MSNRQNNPRQQNQLRPDAHAPYNFIPLPERVVAAAEQFDNGSLDDMLPSHDVFRADRKHGYFDITLTTESPLYIRGPLTRQQAEEKADNKKDHRNRPDFFHTGDPDRPVIPGSSLRGMIRSLVEIVTWSKLTRVSDSPKIYYRAVAAQRTDPLGENYKAVLGRMGANIHAGYLERDGDNWYVHPAQRHRNQPYVKVKALTEQGRTHKDVVAVEGLIPMDSPDYHVQYHDVVTTGDFRPLKPSGYAVSVRSTRPGDARAGVLVCTGNMAESSSENRGRVKTNRRNFALVLERNASAKRIQIDPQAVTDYRDGLTPFQKEAPFDPSYGCLVDGRPIFYINPEPGQAIQHFGHTPFFRIAATIRDNHKTRAVTPSDFVPENLRENPEHYDLAEAMFGYVRDPEAIKRLENEVGQVRQGDRRRAYAGRVVVSDAQLIGAADDLYEPEVTPPILGSPKPTTFQHYLKQPNGRKTPQEKLHHYDTKSPSVRIRGHKLYWRQKRDTTTNGNGFTDEPLNPNDTQHTRMRPLKKGVQFQFRITFENLTAIELGALAWVLALGSEQHHPEARHMLGMGKPYGLGVVNLDATLVLDDRQARYASFMESRGEQVADAMAFAQRFIDFMTDGRVGDFESRTQELLTMLQGRDLTALFNYMTIEPNQFTDRPVLPEPTEVIPPPEVLAKMEAARQQEAARQREEEEREKRRVEAEREREIERRRQRQQGDIVRGTITTTPGYADEDVEFSLDTTPDGRQYTGYLMAEYRNAGGAYQAGQPITAYVLEVEDYGDGMIYLYCRLATKEERKK